MIERELKLYVPKASRAALEKELRAAGARTIALRACYFDTDDRELARAHVALRLRKEGRNWVQTIKLRGPDEVSRIEINHPRPGPELDLAVYKDTPAEAVFAQLRKPLVLRYETDVKRLVLRQESPGGIIELAYDRGTLRAADLTLPICELELEQISGNTATLLAQACDWTERHRLILDLRSKAERGDGLARVALAHITPSGDKAPEAPATVPEFAAIMLKPRKAEVVTVHPSMGLIEAFQASAADCVNQIVRNATFLAGVDAAQATPDLRAQHLHQLRIGIRRLRSCWSFFEKWMQMGGTKREADLRRFFSLLGQTRDTDVVLRAIAPRLANAGMPGVAATVPHNDDDRVAKWVGSPEFQVSMLVLVAQLLAASDAISRGDGVLVAGSRDDTVDGTAPADALLPEDTDKDLATLFSKRLNCWLKRVCREGEDFETLPIDVQHDVRKKIKRLRYSMEFAAGALSAKSYERLHKAVTAAQDRLGELNDLYVAERYYTALATEQPAALFALGWLRATQEHKKVEVHAALDHLGKAGHYKPAKP
ncbi:CYTH and CHAD domain-containing protein [Parapusillimonas sp. SGNA-6]|nr:CYTH and CHAD domain-containing protein [Parapusillimonas sp. SGNA-6]